MNIRSAVHIELTFEEQRLLARYMLGIHDYYQEDYAELVDALEENLNRVIDGKDEQWLSTPNIEASNTFWTIASYLGQKYIVFDR
jgi:hypothetical protein